MVVGRQQVVRCPVAAAGAVAWRRRVVRCPVVGAGAVEWCRRVVRCPVVGAAAVELVTALRRPRSHRVELGRSQRLASPSHPFHDDVTSSLLPC